MRVRSGDQAADVMLDISSTRQSESGRGVLTALGGPTHAAGLAWSPPLTVHSHGVARDGDARREDQVAAGLVEEAGGGDDVVRVNFPDA